MSHSSGYLLIDKSIGSTSFQIVSQLRRKTKIQKIGHAGTLDPFASGLMILLIGREFTKKSDQFLEADKEYIATVHFGIATDSYDIDGEITSRSNETFTKEDLEKALPIFQGNVLQVPPMYSAKKVGGKKLYELARRNITIERQPVLVQIKIELLNFEFPKATLKVSCSKGTYIRSLAHDLGTHLKTGAHLTELRRIRSGNFHIENAFSQKLLLNSEFNPLEHLIR